MITKEEFEKLIDIELTEKDGKLVYKDNLDLKGRKDITELPDNLKVFGWLNLRCSNIIKLPKGLEVECWLDISGTDIEELPEDIKFDDLYVCNMNKPFSFRKVLKVDSGVICKNTSIKLMPEELYVGYICNFSGCTFDKLPNVMEVGYSLYLNDTHITKIPKGIEEVYGRFDISDTKVTKLPDNLVVYEELYLCNTQIEELPKGLIVGDELDLRNTNLKDYSNLHKVCSRFYIDGRKYEEIKDTLAKHKNYSLEWCNETHVTFEPNYKGTYLYENENGRYIKADENFAKILEQKGNLYHIDMYGDGEITYLITDGEGNWAHGETLDEAKADLLYKITDRDKSDYGNLTLDSELSFEDAIVCYRVITGACSFGTKDFIENRLGEKKDEYTISEIIKLTEGEYGNEVFKDFFCKY